MSEEAAEAFERAQAAVRLAQFSQAAAAARAQALERDKDLLAGSLQARSLCERLSVCEGSACGPSKRALVRFRAT